MQASIAINWGLKILGGLLLFVITLIIATSCYHRYASLTEKDMYPPPGQPLSVDGYLMHLLLSW